MIDVIALVTAALLLGIAGLHAYWAAGGEWPARPGASLNAMVVGGEPGAAMPSPPTVVAVAVAIAGVAVGALAARGLVAVPAPGVVRVLTWVGAGAFAVRGVGGFFEGRLRPHTRTLPYGRWNARLYSPLCVALALGLVIALTA